jgi:hypothetical protein
LRYNRLGSHRGIIRAVSHNNYIVEVHQDGHRTGEAATIEGGLDNAE